MGGKVFDCRLYVTDREASGFGVWSFWSYISRGGSAVLVHGFGMFPGIFMCWEAKRGV